MVRVIIILLIFQLSAFTNEEYQCVERSVVISPLMITEATNSTYPNTVYENLWQEVKPNYNKETRTILPRFSIVEMDDQTAKMFNQIKRKRSLRDRYVPVTVKSVGPMSIVEHLDDATRSKKAWVKKRDSNNNPLKDGKGNYIKEQKWLRFFGKLGRPNKNILAAEVEQEGLVLAQSLTSTGKFAYMLNEDSPLFKGDLEKYKGQILRPAMDENGNYLLEQCCEKPEQDIQEIDASLASDSVECFNKYKFIADNDPNEILEFDGSSCNNLELLMPSNINHTESLYSIYKLSREADPEFVQGDIDYMNEFESGVDDANLYVFYTNTKVGIAKWKKMPRETKDALLESWKNPYHRKGLARIPMHIDVKKKVGYGPHGICHYSIASDRNDLYSDHFAHPASACAFLQIAKYFNGKVKADACEIWLGHAFHKTEWDVHGGHSSGNCFDVGSFTNDDQVNDDEKRKGVSFCAGTAQYEGKHDYSKTIEYIETLRKAGAGQILINPHCSGWNAKKKKTVYWQWITNPEIRRLGLTTTRSGHTSHIHFCLPPSEPKIKKACRDGLGRKQIELKKLERKELKYEMPKIDLKKIIIPIRTNSKNED